VRPGAHYMMGGVTVDMAGRPSLPGLWAAGEVTCTGLHGANRLASNSLLEAAVYGARAGEGASQAAAKISDSYSALDLHHPAAKPVTDPLDLVDIRNSLKSLMWRQCGVRRDADGLQDATENIERWCRYVLARQFDDPTGWELQNMLALARLMIHAATLREESRGSHFRNDFPQIDDVHWNRHLIFRRDQEPAEG